LRSQ